MVSTRMSKPAAAAAACLAALASAPLAAGAATCAGVKAVYKAQECCGDPDKVLTTHQLVPAPGTSVIGTSNPCDGTKPTATSMDDADCFANGVLDALEQAGANVTEGYVGGLDTGDRLPWNLTYLEGALCPVNVHWHLGAEHYSAGQFDELGSGPNTSAESDVDGGDDSRRLASDEEARLGFQCRYYDATDTKFTTEYDWQYCVNTHVGATYEVHWPHSAAGACNTPWQFQTPFYDGVFCKSDTIALAPLQDKVGVQSQVFTVVNDEAYFYPDLMRGMIKDGDFGADIAYYTGSTTGTNRDNEVCSQYTPITWQVDRKCHLISASSFDKMCADMMTQKDDMSKDLYPHGSRVLVMDSLAANNLQRL